MSLFGLLPQLASQVGTPQGISPMFGSAGTPGALLPANMMQQTQQSPENINPPSGLFGLKGTGRDIAGILGDALLASGGMAPRYQAQREKEKQGEAMRGFAENPLAAIERIAQIDPEIARKLKKDYDDNVRQTSRTTSQNRNDEYSIREKGLGLFGSMIGGVNESTFEPIRERLIGISKDAGLGLEGLISQAKTPEDLQKLATMAMTPDQRYDNERDKWYKEERLEDYDRAEGRQAANTASQIQSRSERDHQGAVRTGNNTRITNARVYRTMNPVSASKTKSAKNSKVYTFGGKKYRKKSNGKYELVQ